MNMNSPLESEKTPFSFKAQKDLGKRGENVVFEFLRKQPETLEVLDTSEETKFQAYGIDGVWTFESKTTELLEAIFFDIKTDFNIHRTGKVFLEIESSVEGGKKGNLLTTKAQYFFYYDPWKGRLYQLPIYAVRRWYRLVGISMKHYPIPNEGYTTTGIFVPLSELREATPFTEYEIPTIKW